MTEEQFEVYITSEEGDCHFYEYLYDTYHCHDEAIISMMESGDYVEEFMDHLEVIRNEA